MEGDRISCRAKTDGTISLVALHGKDGVILSLDLKTAEDHLAELKIAVRLLKAHHKEGK